MGTTMEDIFYEMSLEDDYINQLSAEITEDALNDAMHDAIYERIFDYYLNTKNLLQPTHLALKNAKALKRPVQRSKR